VSEIGEGVLVVLPLQGSETALRVGLAVNLEKDMFEVLRWQNSLLMAESDLHRDDEMAYLKHIESCLLGSLGQEESGSLMRRVMLLAHILLLGRLMHQRPLEREDGRERHLPGQHFSWPVGAQLPVVPSNR